MIIPDSDIGTFFHGPGDPISGVPIGKIPDIRVGTVKNPDDPSHCQSWWHCAVTVGRLRLGVGEAAGAILPGANLNDLDDRD
jgi:hypothetical protein